MKNTSYCFSYRGNIYEYELDKDGYFKELSDYDSIVKQVKFILNVSWYD